MCRIRVLLVIGIDLTGDDRAMAQRDFYAPSGDLHYLW